MWVIRAGQDALYYKKYIEAKRVYIPWDGYHLDLSGIRTREAYRSLVEREKQADSRTSVSNWAGQLFSFVEEMKVGDFVLIPTKGSHTYALGKITSDYEYQDDESDCLYHSRNIEILDEDIPRSIFSQSIIYSLGAFRTLFKAKSESDILSTIDKWKKEASK